MAKTVAPYAALALWFSALTWWSWRKWGDVYVDFGWQLELPRAINGGKALYQDIVFVPGPISQHLNALWFQLVGGSYISLVVLNLIIAALITVLIVNVTQRLSSRRVGFLCAFFFLTVFGFGQYLGIGNYNYVTPYRHEATHSILFALVSLLTFLSYFGEPSRKKLVVGGIFVGLAFLTKAEFSLALLFMTGVFLALGWLARRDLKAMLREAAWCGAGAALPLLCFLLFLSAKIGFGGALGGLFGNWTILFTSDTLSSPFELRMLGLDRPMANALALLEGSAASGGVILAVYLAD